MATLRLGDGERQQIISAFNAILHRAVNNYPFPLVKEEIREFGLSLLDPTVVKHYEYLRKNKPRLVHSATYNPRFKLRTEKHEFAIHMYHVELPCNDLYMEETHQRYKEIAKWATQYFETQSNATKASEYLEHAVISCSSIGQVKRVLQDEILRFIPTHMQSTFSTAERKSRIPSGFEPDKDALELLSNMLAIGSLSPKSETGIRTAVILPTI